MFATIARMVMRRVHLSDSDLELAAQALRSLAAQYREGAKRQSNPIVREGFEKRASECERMAERMRWFRDVSPT